MKILLTVLTLSLALFACEKYDVPTPASGGATLTPDFYSQMIYKTITARSAGSPGRSQYLAPADGSERTVKRLSGGIEIYEEPALFIVGSQFALVSDLGVGCHGAKGTVKYLVDHKVLTGSWSVDSLGRVHLGPYAFGMGEVWKKGSAGNSGNDEMRLYIQFATDVHATAVPTSVGSLATQLIYRTMPTEMDDVTSGGTQYDFNTAVNDLISSGVCKSE